MPGHGFPELVGGKIDISSDLARRTRVVEQLDRQFKMLERP